MRSFYPQLGVLGSLSQMHTFVGETEVSFGALVSLGLLMVGLGMTLCVLKLPPGR